MSDEKYGQVRFFVEGHECLLAMQGDREEDGHVWDEGDNVGEFATLEEASAAANEWLSDKGNVVNHQKGGIGSVTHWTVEVERCVNDEEWGWVPCDELGRTEDEKGFIPDGAWPLYVDTLDGSPERRAFDRAKRSYHDFLDYKDDGYESVSSCLKLIRASDHWQDARDDARDAWSGPGDYRVAYSDGGTDWTNDGPVRLDSVDDLEDMLHEAHESSTDTRLPYAERVESKDGDAR